MINAKTQRKTTEWERLEISSRKLEIPKEYFMQRRGTIKDRNGIDLAEAEDVFLKVARIHRTIQKRSS